MKRILIIYLLTACILNLHAQKTDYRKLISNADLVYEIPVDRSEAGMPLGNGTMGSLVWTSPSAIKMQINRSDVFAENKSTDSFKERHSDYASGCGFIDINLVDFGDDLFTEDGFKQKLNLYDGLMTLNGNGISASFIACNNKDVFAIEITDLRENPGSINIDLRMLRYSMQYINGENHDLYIDHKIKVKKVGHTALSQLHIDEGNIILTQEFSENDFYNSSAVAIGVSGRDSRARFLNGSTVQLSVEPGKGTFTVFVSSASDFEDVNKAKMKSLNSLGSANSETFSRLLAENKVWWHEFWSRSYVDLDSDDGEADFVEKNYTYFQYIMAASSRGEYQPRYGGMLWYTRGDMREWGSQYWWNNQVCYYNAIAPTNRPELMEPMFSMYSKGLRSFATAARQQWGSKGIWIPETTFFDGIKEMPDDIASEMRDLYLVRKPWEERSQRFREYAASKPKHNPRWNWGTVGRWEEGHWIIPEKGQGPFGHVTHIFSATAEIAYLSWLRYEYTQDKDWLRDTAYPLMRGAVEFYRNFPHLRKMDDGKYHIYHTNNNEGIWDAHNSFMDIAAIRGMTPVLIKASEILDVDEDMRPVWQEFVDNISPLPSSDDIRDYPAGKPDYFTGAFPPAGRGDTDNPSFMIYYDHYTAATEDKDILKKGNNSFDLLYSEGVDQNTSVHVLDKKPIAAALLGRSEAVKYLIPNQIRSNQTPEKDFCDWEGSGRESVLANRMSLREGPGSLGAQRLGNAATAVNTALIQSVPSAPGKDPVIYLFPAWPEEWNARFELLARGSFMVSASVKEGKVGEVDIVSQEGGVCRIKNPWTGKKVTIDRNGKQKDHLKGDILTIQTQKGDRIRISEL